MQLEAANRRAEHVVGLVTSLGGRGPGGTEPYSIPGVNLFNPLRSAHVIRLRIILGRHRH